MRSNVLQIAEDCSFFGLGFTSCPRKNQNQWPTCTFKVLFENQKFFRVKKLCKKGKTKDLKQILIRTLKVCEPTAIINQCELSPTSTNSLKVSQAETLALFSLVSSRHHQDQPRATTQPLWDAETLLRGAKPCPLWNLQSCTEMH